jgi:eukaryotic-like serine/threonine-protein kinase
MAEPGEASPTIAGYSISRELGRGGMGVVYEARHLALNRRVAIKVVRGFASREEVARFRIEAEAVARLQHPNIVQIYEVGEHAGAPYLALEFVDAGSLAARIRRDTISPCAAAELIAILSRAVQHAHSRGVVHRDLKPANILLSQDGSPRIGDFGLAKFADDPGRSRSGLIVGTPAYMAPEQAAGRGELVGPPADVWALGAILYECLTCRPPFGGSTSIDTIQQVLAAEPTPPSRLSPRIPRDLETICLKCLRKEPDQRYRTAGDLADDLDRFLEGRPILARRVPWWEQLGKWARRRPAAAALIVVTLGAVAALAGLGYRYFQNLERYNSDLEAKNSEITNQSRELERANTATLKERDRAEANLTRTLDAIDGLLSVTGVDRLAQVPQIDRARSLMLERALQVCDRLLEGQENNPRLRLFQALALRRAGRILTLLQQYREAEERLDRALAILREHRPGAEDIAAGALFVKAAAHTHLDRGKLFLRTDRSDRARQEYAAAEELLRTHSAGPLDPDAKFLLAVANADLAVAALDAEDADQAVLHLGRARQNLEELFEANRKDVAYAGAYAFVLNTLGAAHMKKGETERAAELFGRGIAVSREVLKILPGQIEYTAELARSVANLGVADRVRGYFKRAGESLTEALAIREELARNHPDLAAPALDLSWSYRQLGQLEDSKENFRAADDWYTKAEKRLTRDAHLDQEPHARKLLAEVYQARAASREQLKRFDEAAEDLALAAALVPLSRQQSLRVQRAGLLLSTGKVARAVKEIDGVLAEPNQLSSEDRFRAAIVLARAAETDKSEALARRAVEELVGVADSGHFQDPKQRRLLENHPHLKGLRGRSDFMVLLARINKQ